MLQILFSKYLFSSHSRYVHHNKHAILRRCLSKLSSSNESFADEPNPDKHESVAMKLDPRAVFPWRHSPFPLNRLVPGTVEFKEQGGYIGPHLPPMTAPFRTLAWINAAGFLGAKIFSYRSWKHDLEMAFMTAFALGVDGMLRDVYRLKESDDIEDTSDADADASQHSDISKGIESDENNSYPIEFDLTINAADDYNLHLVEEEQASHEMLDPTLISLYRSAHTYGKHKLRIKLRSRPTDAKIVSFFVLPFLTRAEVHDNVSLKHSFRNILNSIHDEEMESGRTLSHFQIANLVAEKLDDMAKKQMRRRGDKKMQMTIVAQVAVHCDEIFFVKDLESDTVLQGDDSELIRDVTHLVRFEMVVDLDSQSGKSEIGRWKITDWDDLLDGNVFWT